MFVALCNVVLASGVGVAVPESAPRGSVEADVRGEGSMIFVRLGSGDEGREGGSWVVGVAAGSAIVCMWELV